MIVLDSLAKSKQGLARSNNNESDILRARPSLSFLPPREASSNANIVSAYSNCSFGNMSLSYGDTTKSLRNREVFLTGLGIDFRDLVCAKQIHSDRVRYITEKDKGSGAKSCEASIPDTDAFVTDKKNIPLAIFTADCLSIFLYDAAGPAIGIIHAGWRSTKEGIAAKTVKAMRELFSTYPNDLAVFFGPCIRSCCYEVGKGFDSFFANSIIRRDGRFFLDLAGQNRDELLGLGVKEQNIFDSNICTFCRSDEFFSFRKDSDACGRSMSVIMLK